MTLTSTDLVLSLDEVGLADAPRAGHKAATLGELRRAGFPVPDGVVLTTDALARTLAAAGLDAAADPDQVAAVPLPAEVAAAISAAAVRLGGGPLAVRSSGVDEDLPGASYAGQYETVLGVPAGELAAAVRRCWASAFTATWPPTGAPTGPGRDPAMAVLVQPMVAAEAAGVAFSADPVTGDRDTAVVNAVRRAGGPAGRGQGVARRVGGPRCGGHPPGGAGGRRRRRGRRPTWPRSPAGSRPTWARPGHRVGPGRRRAGAAPGAADHRPSRPGSRAGAGTGRGAARLLGAGGQPRAQTVDADDPLGFWVGPQPAMRRMFAEFGLLAETLELAQIGGWEYARLVPLGGKDRPAPPARLMPLLIRLVPRLRRRIADAVAAVRSDKAGRFVEQWYRQWQTDLAEHSAGLRDTDLGALDDEELDADTARALALLHQGLDVHFLLHGALMPILAELAFACRELLGWSDEEAFELLVGLSATSTEPARRLAELAGAGRRAGPRCARLLDRSREAPWTGWPTPTRSFAEAFAAYQREFACRALRYEMADPIHRRDTGAHPSAARRPARPRLRSGRRRRGAGRPEGGSGRRARAALAGRRPEDRARFERALARAERAYPVREDNEFLTTSVPLALLRYRVLEIGRRLAARGQLGRRDDVFFLTLDEARAALHDGQARRALVSRRRGERAFIEQHPGPATYGKDPGPPPPLDALPAEARFTMTALLWYIDRIFETATSSQVQQPGIPALGGIAASPGRHTGPVRVVMDESEFGKLRPGDVLVCPVTSPVWSVLFPSVGALVTDTGGLLSHPAIIAREYAVPAVVATGNATALLGDDQVVTVDGGAGRIEVQP